MSRYLLNSINESWIDWFQILLLLLLAPLFLFPSTKYVWILLVIPSLWIMRWMFKKNFFERTPIDWAVLLLTLQIMATCIIVADLEFTLPKITNVLYGISIFYAIAALLKSERLLKIGIFLFLAGGIAFAFIGVLGMIRSDVKYLTLLYKIVEKFPQIDFNLPGAEKGFHPNAVGGTLILIIPIFAVLLYSFIRGGKKRGLFHKNYLFFIFLIVGFVFTSGVLLLTQSRGSWIGLVLSGLILLMTKKSRIKWGVIIILLCMVVYIFLSGTGKVPLTVKEAKKKVMRRLPLWYFASDIIVKHPVFGIGLNQMRRFPQIGHYQAHAHNHFLHTAAELGIPGLIAYLAIVFGSGVMCVIIWLKSQNDWMRMAALGLGCGQLAQLIFGMADSISFGTKVGLIFWLSLALIAALYNHAIKENKNQENPKPGGLNSNQ